MGRRVHRDTLIHTQRERENVCVCERERERGRFPNKWTTVAIVNSGNIQLAKVFVCAKNDGGRKGEK